MDEKYYSVTGNFIYTGIMQEGDHEATAEEISEYEAGKDANFNNACAQFRSVCATIGSAIGNPDFKGGFDEYSIFIQSEFAQKNPAIASLYASMWSGANEYAKYEGAKLGYGQPEWWYQCWKNNEPKGE